MNADPDPSPTHVTVRALDVAAKAALLFLSAVMLMYPEVGHVEDKAAGLRSVGYTAVAFVLPVTWYTLWRARSPFPWLADLLVTITCFTDTLGNRLDLYDTVVWFDDLVHFANTGIITLAVLLLTLDRTATGPVILDRALAFGLSAAVTWEIAEYLAFVSDSSERFSAYPDTLGDLALGAAGTLTAALTLHLLWSRSPTATTDQREQLHGRPAWAGSELPEGEGDKQGVSR